MRQCPCEIKWGVSDTWLFHVLITNNLFLSPSHRFPILGRAAQWLLCNKKQSCCPGPPPSSCQAAEGWQTISPSNTCKGGASSRNNIKKNYQTKLTDQTWPNPIFYSSSSFSSLPLFPDFLDDLLNINSVIQLTENMQFRNASCQLFWCFSRLYQVFPLTFVNLTKNARIAQMFFIETAYMKGGTLCLCSTTRLHLV